MADAPTRWSPPQRVAAVALLGVVLVVTAINGYRSVVVDQHGFHLFDWLISYDGGFVRRGLAGEVLLAFDRLTFLDAPLMVFALQLMAYALLLHGAYLLSVRSVPTAALVLMLVSPAVFTFHLFDVAGGYRKEILALALVAQHLAWSRRTDREPVRFRLLVTSLAVMVALVFVSELVIVFVPYLFLTAANLRWTPQRTTIVGVLGLGIAAAFLMSVTNSGSVHHVADICARLRETLPPSPSLADCEAGTAVSWLANPTSVAVEAVGDYVRGQGRTLALVLPLVVAGFVPVVRETLGRAGRRQLRWVAGAVAASLLAWLPLFVVALDWGRLVYVQAAALTLAVLYVRSNGLLPRPQSRRATTALVAIVPAYALLWNLDHANDLLGGGILSVFGVGAP